THHRLALSPPCGPDVPVAARAGSPLIIAARYISILSLYKYTSSDNLSLSVSNMRILRSVSARRRACNARAKPRAAMATRSISVLSRIRLMASLPSFSCPDDRSPSHRRVQLRFLYHYFNYIFTCLQFHPGPQFGLAASSPIMLDHQGDAQSPDHDKQ